MLYKYAKLIITLLILLLISPLLIIHSARSLIIGEAFYPAEIKDALNNPYMGWAPSAEGGPYAQPHRLVYINTTWRELEPYKGEYAFNALEQKYNFDYWKSKGIHIIFRFNMDFPGNEKHIDIPDWLFEEIGGDGTWYDLDYGKGFSPNYSNPLLISYHRKLIEALAVRYNSNSMLPIIALGSIGHWGEWHTKQGQTPSIPFPGIEVSDQYVSHYLKFFTGKKLLMRRPFEIAQKNGLGLYNDSFGNAEQTHDYFLNYIDEGYQDNLTGAIHPPMPDHWKNAPSGGEIASPPGMACFDDKNIKETLEQIRSCHTSWLGPSCPAYYSPGAEQQDNYNLILRTMGYRFVLYSVKHPLKVKAGNPLPINMVWKNQGVAPFYYHWPMELSLAGLDSAIACSFNTPADIRKWLPGKTDVEASFQIPDDLPGGRYILCAAIIDPDTGKPAIDLAIEGRRPDGRYSLDQVIVER